MVYSRIYRLYTTIDRRDIDISRYIDSIYDDHTIDIEDGKRLTSRGKGGKNEVRLLYNIVNNIVYNNRMNKSIYAYNTICKPIDIHQQPNISDMYISILRDIYMRYEMMRGKKIDSYIRNIYIIY